MAKLILQLKIDPTTGKKNILVNYHGDAGELPMEHEEAHRELVDQLIAGGALTAAEVGQVIIDREQTPTRSEQNAEPEAIQQPQSITNRS